MTNVTEEELKTMLYSLDWIEILQQAVESRPSSWGVKTGEEYKAVDEWRNASDTLTGPIWKRLEENIEDFSSKSNDEPKVSEDFQGMRGDQIVDKIRMEKEVDLAEKTDEDDN